MNRRTLFPAVLLTLVFLALPAAAGAGTIFSDDFESGTLAKWWQKGNSQAVVEPEFTGSTNQILTFTGSNTAGDLFTAKETIPVSLNQLYTLSFDHWGPAGATHGGLVGWNDGSLDGRTPPTTWIAGTTGNGSYPGILVNDGSWHSYSLTIDPGDFEVLYPGSSHPTHIGLVVEIWRGASGSAKFDNFRVSTVPVPSAVWMGLGLLALLGAGRRVKLSRAR